MKMIENVSDWLSYAGGALIKVADSAGSTVPSFAEIGPPVPEPTIFEGFLQPMGVVAILGM